MKKTILLLFIIALACCVRSQSISPDRLGTYCPGVYQTFVIKMPATGAYNNPYVGGEKVSGYDSNVPMVGGTPTVSSDGSITTFTFQGYFTDYPTPQGIYLTYLDGSAQSNTVHFVYYNITSFNRQDNPNYSSKPVPQPSSIQATPCQSQSFNISFTNVYYYNLSVSPVRKYGPVTDYLWLLPAGWQLGTNVSDGATWLPGGSNVTVTSDLNHGGSIQVRAAPCFYTQVPGPIATIPITRPLPSYAVSGSTGPICSGTSGPYTVGGLQAGSTVSWTASPAGVVTINTPNAPATTITKTGNGNVTLTATVTDACGNVGNASLGNIIVGMLTPGQITVGIYTDYDVEVRISPVPGATSYNWYLYGKPVAGEHTENADIITACGKYDLVSVEAVSVCGVSDKSYNNSIRVPCHGGGTLRFSVSPNPATNAITVTANALNDGKAIADDPLSFDEIRIYDLQGNLKKRQPFNKTNKATINVSGLARGTYLVEIISGPTKEKHQLLITK